MAIRELWRRVVPALWSRCPSRIAHGQLTAVTQFIGSRQLADDNDYASLPLTSEQLDRVLLLLQERDPTAWSDAKAVSTAAPAVAETAATAIN